MTRVATMSLLATARRRALLCHPSAGWGVLVAGVTCGRERAQVGDRRLDVVGHVMLLVPGGVEGDRQGVTVDEHPCLGQPVARVVGGDAHAAAGSGQGLSQAGARVWAIAS